jgi:hypothetical protein
LYPWRLNLSRFYHRYHPTYRTEGAYVELKIGNGCKPLIVDEFVTSLWYRSLTDDDDFPLALSRTLDFAFAELAGGSHSSSFQLNLGRFCH